MLTAITIPINGEVVRMVKIRNPYGSKSKKEWQLDWKNDSDELRQYLTEELDMNDDLDGIFWMRYSNFKEFFYCTSVCLY